MGCGKRWAEIDVSAVPSRCLAKSRRGFLNEKLSRDRPLTVDEDRTGDRHPEDQDRVTCRQNLREAVLSSSKIKGKQCFPHELVRRVIGGRHASTLEDDLVNAQWAAVKQDVQEQIAATGAKRGALVALVDVSGSMAGVPMEVSIALGLLVSDLADEPFRHRVLTFESQPRWHKIPSLSSPVEQIRNLSRAPWGGSTNFAAAMDLLLAACVDGKVQAEDVPDLIVSATCSSTRPTVRGGRRTTSGYQGNGLQRATSCRRSRTGICGATLRAAVSWPTRAARACACSR